MGRRQAVDLLEEGAGLVDALQLGDQEIGDAALVDAIGRLRQHQDGLGLGSEGEETPRRVVVVERPHAEVVAGAEQLALARIPEHEGEIPQQTVQTVLAPGQVGFEDQASIPDRASAFAQSQRGQQFVAVVQTHVGDDHAAGGGVAHGLRFEGQLRGSGQQGQAQPREILAPVRGSVRSAPFQERRHAFEFTSADRCPVLVEQAEDPAHDESHTGAGSGRANGA